jgi:hypothetical protein
MSRRIEVELTSNRGDGTWTWRAAGAREPKGVVDGALLGSAGVGDVVKVEVDSTIDGLVVLAVIPTKEAKAPKAETLQLLGSRRDEPLVTTTLTGKRPRDDDRGGRRGGRGGPRRERSGGGPRGEGGRRPDDRGDKRGDARGDNRGDGRHRRPRAAPESDAPARPAPKRLRARRTHRNAYLAGLPEEQRPLAELVLQGGVPALRQALERQSAVAREHGQPEVRGGVLVELAERLLPDLKAAEWHDRAEAALKQVDDVDLRDLRSVVSAADRAGRDDARRQLADELRSALSARVEREHQAWLDELTVTVQEGRIVRALRLSSRPPKAGAPLPADLAARLAEQATTALTADVSQERFATLLEAVSFSPVHLRVAATSIPAEPSADLLSMVRRIATRVPAVAAQFGVVTASAAPAS